MNPSLPLLQELHQLEMRGAEAAETEHQRMIEIRTLVPAPVLAHYNRLVVNKRKPIAEVRRGICSACHLRLASWVRQAAHDDDLHLCENCGAYLVFASNETEAPKAARAKETRLAMIRAAVVH